MDQKLAQLIRPEIKALSAYHVPDPGELIKLDAMENPYTIPDDMLKKWQELLAQVSINRYPDPSASELTSQLKTYMEVPEGSEVLLGNGSDELIQIMAMTLAKPGAKILAPEPGFVMYKMIATFVGMDYIGVPLADDFSLDKAAMLDAIRQHQPALIFLAYPNNPTGNLFDEQAIIDIIKTAEGVVVVDEAYHPFACTSFMSRLTEFENLLVMRTVSKMGMAGLRLGLLAGSKALINEFDKVRLPYNINVLTQATATFALQHADVFENQAAIIRKQRDWLFDELNAINGCEVFSSRANFILYRLTEKDATQVFEALKTVGVLIKNLHPAGGMLSQCMRVTVGKPEENQAFVAALKKILA